MCSPRGSREAHSSSPSFHPSLCTPSRSGFCDCHAVPSPCNAFSLSPWPSLTCSPKLCFSTWCPSPYPLTAPFLFLLGLLSQAPLWTAIGSRTSHAVALCFFSACLLSSITGPGTQRCLLNTAEQSVIPEPVLFFKVTSHWVHTIECHNLSRNGSKTSHLCSIEWLTKCVYVLVPTHSP